eukprot:12672705-Alexandrium_andersonii.AAC.1
MSASLVGSEMCIRDSASSEAWELRSEAQAAGAQGASLGGETARARAPVSYTHLTLPTICSV